MGKAFDAWKKKYAANIAGLANSNDAAGNYGGGKVDMGVGADMLISNLKGATNYKGGGSLDFGVASAELQKAYAEDDRNRNSGGSGSGGGTTQTSIQQASVAQTQAQQAALAAELAQLKIDADAAKSAAYVNSRVSAIGNNEMLAMQGLAGNMYTNPQSGMSESSRIGQDANLQNNLNAANQQQTALGTQARTAFANTNADNQLEMAKYIANLQLSRDQMTQNNNQFNQNQKSSVVTQQMQIIQQLNAGTITRAQANAMLVQLGLPTI